jgi:hypothetical protein
MALDTQNKRLSVIHLGSPWRGMLPLPDSSLATQTDRQHIMFLYRGAEARALVGTWSNVIQCRSANQRIDL